MASAPQPQDGLHAVGQAEVDQQEKHRREGHHDEHHDGGHRGLLPARPGHLLDLADHLTHVLSRVYCRHWVELLPTTPKPRRGAVVDSCSLCRDGPAASARPPVLLSCRRPYRKSVVSGKSVSVRVDLGGRRINKKKK